MILISLPSKSSLGIPAISLTVRFHLTENVAGRSSGKPYTPNNDFFFFFFGGGGEGGVLCMNPLSRG